MRRRNTQRREKVPMQYVDDIAVVFALGCTALGGVLAAVGFPTGAAVGVPAAAFVFLWFEAK